MQYQPQLAQCNDGQLATGMSLEESFVQIASTGCTGFEIAPLFCFPGQEMTVEKLVELERGADAVARQAQAAGGKIIGGHWALAGTKNLHLTSRDPAIRRMVADYLIALVRLIAAWGGKFIVFGSPFQRRLLDGMTKEEGHKLAADVFGLVLPACEKYGVKFALEPLGPECPDGNYLTCADEAVELMKIIDSPFVRILLDMKAMYAGEKDPIADVIKRCIDYLIHFHVNGVNRFGPGFHEKGMPYFAPAMKMLALLNYQGWISSEPFLWRNDKPETRDFPTIEQQAVEMPKYIGSCFTDQLPALELVV